MQSIKNSPLWKPVAFLLTSIQNFIKHDMIERSGYIAFLAIISIFPFMIFTLSLASFFNKSEFGTKAIDYLYVITPTELQKLIEPIFSQFESGKIPFLTFSTIILIYSASTVIQAARKGFHKIFAQEVQTQTNQFVFRLQSALLMLLLCISLYAMSALTIILPAIAHLVEYVLQIDIQNLALYKKAFQYSSLFITFMCILIFYKALSPKVIPFKIHMFGAIASTATLIPTAEIVKFYIQNAANYNLIYGSLSSIILAIIALQIFTAIFFWGAEINGILFQNHQLKNSS